MRARRGGRQPLRPFCWCGRNGKTFLAVEAAQREIAQGRSGRLLCFNRLLAQSLRDRMSGAPRLHVNTINGEMLRLAGLHRLPMEQAESSGKVNSLSGRSMGSPIEARMRSATS